MVRARKSQRIATSAASDTVINVKINADNEIESLEVGDIEAEGTDSKAATDEEDFQTLVTEDGDMVEIKVENRTVIEHVCGKCDKTYKSLGALQRHLILCREKVQSSPNKRLRSQKEQAEAKQSPVKKLRRKATATKIRDTSDSENEMETVVLNMNVDSKICFCCDEELETAHNGHIKCEACPKSFKSFPSINKHVHLLHSDSSEFGCPFCNATCPNQATLDLHLESHRHGKPYSCVNCGKDFTRKYHLDRHLNYTNCDSSKPKSELPCQVCGKVFSRTDNLREHLRGHIGQATRRRDYQCPHCEKSFYGSSLLNIHIRTHTGEKPFPCDLCEKSFPSNGALRKHRRMHTGERPYRCTICERCFSAKETLNRHMKIHTGERPHVCEICNKSFIQRTQLRAHLSHHTGDLEFDCDQCDKSFNRKQRLEAHIKFDHENAEKLPCKLCDKEFTRKDDLQRHVASHMGIKKFKCDICDKEYATSARLEAHKSTQHPKKAPKCKICAEEFKQVDHLMRHMRTKHRDILQDFVGDAELELTGTVLDISSVNAEIEAEQAVFAEEEVQYDEVQTIGSNNNQIEGDDEEEVESYDVPLLYVDTESETNDNTIEVKYIIQEEKKIKQEASTSGTVKKDEAKSPTAVVQQQKSLKKMKEDQKKMQADKLKQQKEVLKNEKLEKAKAVKEKEMEKEKSAALKRKQKEANELRLEMERNEAQKKTEKEAESKRKASQSAALKREDPDDEMPIFLDDATLKESVSQLLSMLVDEETLSSFGWPRAPVEEVLSSVIEQCGQTPADYNSTSDYTTKIRENAKLLFTVVIDNDFIKTLLNNHTVDEVIVQVLKLAQTKSL